MRVLVVIAGLLFIVGIGGGAAYYIAGQTEAPKITIEEPAALVGQSSTLALTVDSPPAEVDRVTVSMEQGGKVLPVASLDPKTDSSLKADGPVSVTRDIGKKTLPELQAGPAAIVVTGVAHCDGPSHAFLEHEKGRGSSARSSANLRRLDASLHQSRRLRARRVSRDTAGRDVRCPRGDARVSRVPRERRRRLRRRVVEGGVLCRLARRDKGASDRVIRQRCRRQRGKGDVRSSDLSEEIQTEPHPVGRFVSLARRSHNRSGIPGAEACLGFCTGGSAAVVPQGQRRAPSSQRGKDCGLCRQRRRHQCCGRNRSGNSATRRWSQDSPTTARISTVGSRSIARFIWASIFL